MKGVGHVWGDILVGVTEHKEHDYMWLLGGDLNRFRDIKPLMKWTGWGMPR